MLLERKEFAKRLRKEVESIHVFLTALKRMARDCFFRDSDELLRD